MEIMCLLYPANSAFQVDGANTDLLIGAINPL